MKIFILSLATFLFLVASEVSFAATVIIDRTKDWTGIPIVVDEGTHTFTAPKYYYSFKGHRCFAEKQTFVDEDGVIYESNGTSIYCYPE